MSDDYARFIAAKGASHSFPGIEVAPDALPPSLFPHQRDLARWALRKGRAAVFAQTGLGKSRMLASWAGEVAKRGRVLILAPLAVGPQNVAEAAAVGVEIMFARRDTGARIAVANYENLAHFNPHDFVGVVLDECFAAGTVVDVPDGRMHIEDIRVGDRIINASGADVVSDVHRREVPFAVRVTIAGRSCVASPNHPFFTQRGWIGAQDLRAGDHALGTGPAMRLVRDGVLAEIAGAEGAAFLREVLLSEMADVATGDPRESAQRRGRGETGAVEVEVAQDDGGGTSAGRAHSRVESNEGPDRVREDLPHVEGDAPRTFRTWRKWPGSDGAADDPRGGARSGVGDRAGLVVGEADSRLSHALQDRLGPSRTANRDRGGWILPCESEDDRREEGRAASWLRVDGAEILEPGHPDLERLRSPDGRVYFYDLGGTRHPSFSVNGALVHNSSILKSYDGATRTALIEAFAKTPYRLCCTATPAPNDFTELGNHSEFLGVRTRTEMLAEFFVHDGATTQEWRLKGHATQAFWRWLATWGAVVRSPADLGHDASAYELPPLRMHERVIPVDHRTSWASGELFATNAVSLAAQRSVRRVTTPQRAEIAAEVAAQPGQCIVWCELNDESKACVAAIGKDAVEITGSMDVDEKEARLTAFTNGEARVVVTKPSIAGFGLNWQRCSRMTFVGASHSYEMTYQAIRRCHRFGQKSPVDVVTIRCETEALVVENFKRKEAEAEKLGAEMAALVGDAVRAEVLGATKREWKDYDARAETSIPSWLAGA